MLMENKERIKKLQVFKIFLYSSQLNFKNFKVFVLYFSTYFLYYLCVFKKNFVVYLFWLF